jgi:hypothetical protein
MKIQNKPDYLIFADSAKKGEVSDFPDVSRGWGITIEQTASKPPMEWMNGAFNRVDKNMLYLLQQGVPEWSENVKYPANAIIKYNGILYTSIAENENSKPTSTAEWKKTHKEIAIASASLNQAGIVKLNSAIDSDSETEAATPKAIKEAYDLANEKLSLLGGKLTGDLTIEKTNAGIILSTNDTNYTLSTSSAGDAFSFYFPDAVNDYTQRLIYTKQDKTFNFKACEVKINNNDVVTSDRFESSLSERGYQKLPGGLIIQWGYQKSSFSNRQQKVTFPVTFPRAAFCVVCNNFGPIDLYDDTADVGCYSKTTTSFQAYNCSDKNPAGFCWIAFGN